MADPMTDITLEKRARELLAEVLSIPVCMVDDVQSVKAAYLLEAMTAALRLSAGADWQPIETAPKDGLIDIWIDDKHGGTRRCDCHYDSICREWRTIRPDGRLLSVHERHVTHWMPRPAAPRNEPGEG